MTNYENSFLHFVYSFLKNFGNIVFLGKVVTVVIFLSHFVRFRTMEYLPLTKSQNFIRNIDMDQVGD